MTDAKFIYDGWNCIIEANASDVVQRRYMWGLDLSGSEQGAGGVGGLVAVQDVSGTNGVNFVAFDGNGNVAALVRARDGTVSANYEYGPFGEVMRSSGSMAKVNVIRFSTKYQDDESDLVYYGYRFYNFQTGKWINRDPLEEKAGFDLYSLVNNRPVNSVDILGRIDVEGPEASIFSWIEQFSSDFDDWDPFNDAYAKTHGNVAPDYGVQTGIKIAVNELAISANPTPGRTYNSTTKETRGRLKIALTLDCSSYSATGKIKKARLSKLEAQAGWTPIRGVAGAQAAGYDPAEGQDPVISGLNNTGGCCVTVTVRHLSRVGKFGQQAAKIFTGTGVPWIAREIEYTLCCDRKYTIKYSGTHFPSRKSYLNDVENGRWNQTDLPNFMFLGGGVLAPMVKIAEIGR